MVNPKVAIVGYGRVGKVLLKALPLAGWEVCQLISRQDLQSAKCKIQNSIRDLREEIGLVILCLRERDIEKAVEELPHNRSGNVKILCHTAGASSAEILASAREKGWKVMAWHPMQTFTGDEDGDILNGVTFGIDGDGEAVVFGERLARDLGGVPYRVQPELRREYHLGAVIACNLLVGLVGDAAQVFKKAGMDEARALKAMAPLMQATVKNIARKGLKESITGPILRGDVTAINNHLETLRDIPETEELYRLLSLSLVSYLEETEEMIILKKILEERRK